MAKAIDVMQAMADKEDLIGFNCIDPVVG